MYENVFKVSFTIIILYSYFFFNVKKFMKIKLAEGDKSNLRPPQALNDRQPKSLNNYNGKNELSETGCTLERFSAVFLTLGGTCR